MKINEIIQGDKLNLLVLNYFYEKKYYKIKIARFKFLINISLSNCKVIFKSYYKIIKSKMKKFLKFIKYFFKYLLIIIFLAILWLTIFNLFQTPSLDRNWMKTDKILAGIDFYENKVFIKNIRDFKHISLEEFEVNYYDSTFYLDKINSVYYIVEPFWYFDWPAHTMLSFGFSDWQYVVISVELRKEVWESFNPFLWIANRYELMYLIWSERDLIRLRANVRKNEVRMYPIKASKEKMQSLFVSMLKRADRLSRYPEFYNTIYNTCATNILKHVNELREEKDKISPFNLKIILPYNSDKIVFDEWLMNTELNFEEARKHFKINELSIKYWDSKNYSQKIRKKMRSETSTLGVLSETSDLGVK